MILKKPLQIGITGGIGSGKSLVCHIFTLLGVPVYDADSRAKTLMTTDGILVSQIKKEFGVLSFRADGSLNREYLAEHVFGNPDKLKILNSLVHPRVGEDYAHWVTEQTSSYALKEAALLFEAKSNQALDKIIVVSAPEELRIQRVLQRDKHRTEQQVKDIIRNQLEDEKKVKLADYVILNDERTPLIPQVIALHKQFLSMAQ
ncbi:MAG TPA: dephospho-CoA kinase [Cyclobacteriaceae bacterium]|nr:dephospho-CoA kinase [Cyclobacteriaceae bacterium]HMV07987.1 dephospho-CoA kinase [Cyclobacteriaceae bacterium]HMW99121.1 dephospho-CoA kinase [Cyclobacteriaceae bacterium]HMX48246.1 dephospho-CoA kinase [Cyclobacteriaceae bacterium]HMY95051.1 dephospho-CoA kinase [Cyclobacteriaceae bacterium]